MASLVELANMALGEVGAEGQRITTLDDSTAPARLCKLHIYQAVREVLQASLWKCARRQVDLAQLTDVPTFDWAYAYQLPADYIRLVSFNEIESGEQPQDLYEIQDGKLLTDESEASLVYIRDLTYTGNDVNLMTPLMTKACILNLAEKVSWGLQQSRTLKDALAQRFEEALRRAKSADTREEFRPLIDPAAGSRWMPARY